MLAFLGTHRTNDWNGLVWQFFFQNARSQWNTQNTRLIQIFSLLLLKKNYSKHVHHWNNYHVTYGHKKHILRLRLHNLIHECIWFYHVYALYTKSVMRTFKGLSHHSWHQLVHQPLQRFRHFLLPRLYGSSTGQGLRDGGCRRFESDICLWAGHC